MGSFAFFHKVACYFSASKLRCPKNSGMSFRYLGLLLGLLPGLWGCSPPKFPSEATRYYTDDLGRVVALSHTPRRIVTLAPSLTEVVFAAGAGHLLVGITTADDYPPAVNALPRFSALPVNFEAIVALKPDLVLATDQVNNPRDTATFAALGLPVYFFSYATLEDVFDAILTTGRLLGTESAAQRTVDSLRTRLAHLQALMDTLSTRPSVLLLISDETLYAFGQGSYVHDLIARAGGQSLTATLPVAGPVLSDEFVLQAKPEVIVVTMGADYAPSRLLEHHPSWDMVPAVLQGRICGIEPSWILRPGPRLIAGLEALAHCLHPDRVPYPTIEP
jgi:iron complex transport system substrate-binding protein